MTDAGVLSRPSSTHSTQSAPGRSLRQGRLRSLLVGIAAPLGLLATWQLVAQLTPSPALPSPSEIWTTVRADGFSFYFTNLSQTLTTAAIGFVIGTVIALALGVVAVQVPSLERTVRQLATLTYTVPVLAIGVILTTIYPTEVARIALAAIFVIFTTTLGTILGLRSADPAVLDLAEACGLGRARRLWLIRLPAARPALVTAFQIAAPSALLGTILAEYLGGRNGLGVAMLSAQRGNLVNRTWALGLLAAIVAAVAFGVIGLVGRRSMNWQSTISTAPLRACAPRGSVHTVGIGVVRGLVTVVAAIVLWYFVLWVLRIDPFLSAGPREVLEWVGTGPDAAAHREVLFTEGRATAVHALVGLIAGLLAGLLGAVAMLHHTVKRTMLPVAMVLQTVPFVAFLPVALVLFGRGLALVAVVGGLVCFFPVLMNVHHAMERTSPQVLDVLQVSGHGTVSTITRARIPAAAPALFAALQLAIPAAVAGALVVEYLALGSGLGHLMLRSSITFSYSQLWSAVVIVTAATLLAAALAAQLERSLSRRLGLR